MKGNSRALVAEADPERPATLSSAWSERVIGPLEEQTWLERASAGLAAWLQPVVTARGADRVMDLLHGRWLGHALHPLLTDVPIGFWSSTSRAPTGRPASCARSGAPARWAPW